MHSISKMDFATIEARVNRSVQRRSLSTQSLGLLHIVIEQMFPSLLDTTPETITDGSDDRGIDAIHIVEGGNVADIYLLQCKYREKWSSCDKTINDGEIHKISHFLSELFNRAETLEACNNERLKQAVLRIWGIHEAGAICRYHVIFCSNGNGFSTTALNVIAGTVENYPQVKFEFYGAPEIILGFQQEGLQRESGKLQVIAREILERIDGDVRGAVASISAKSFIDLIATPDRQNVKRYLFDDNLRIFLGVKGGYNSAIIETATSGDNYLFWYLNNGITITCKNFSYNKSHISPVLSLDEFQIVNGAQTSHSLFEAYRENPGKLDDVALLVRVYATDRPDIAERVAVATNSQARIQGRDLRANTGVLKKLELAFLSHGYFFERKRNMHSEKAEDKRIDALKLGQIILAYDLKEPDKAKSESDSIFDYRFDSVFHNRLDVSRLISLFELYRTIERLRDAYSVEYGENAESSNSHRYLIYGHWFVLFACRMLLIQKRKDEIPQGQAAVQLIEEAIGLISKACGQQKAVAHYQMFRSPKTRDKIVAELSGKQTNFFHLLAD